MKNDFTTAPLAPGLIHLAGGGTVEKSFYASHTEILTLPTRLLANAVINDLEVFIDFSPCLFTG